MTAVSSAQTIRLTFKSGWVTGWFWCGGFFLFRIQNIHDADITVEKLNRLYKWWVRRYTYKYTYIKSRQLGLTCKHTSEQAHVGHGHTPVCGVKWERDRARARERERRERERERERGGGRKSKTAVLWAFKNLGWSRCRDANPVPTSPLADDLTTTQKHLEIMSNWQLVKCS